MLSPSSRSLSITSTSSPLSWSVASAGRGVTLEFVGSTSTSRGLCFRQLAQVLSFEKPHRRTEQMRSKDHVSVEEGLAYTLQQEDLGLPETQKIQYT